MGHRGLLLRVVPHGRDVLGEGGGRGLSPKLHILRAARQTHLTALRLTQNKARASWASNTKRERDREKIGKARERKRETTIWTALTAATWQHPAAFPQQAHPQQNGSTKITYTYSAYYAYAAWQVAPAKTLQICCQIAYEKPPTATSIINVSLLPLVPVRPSKI